MDCFGYSCSSCSKMAAPMKTIAQHFIMSKMAAILLPVPVITQHPEMIKQLLRDFTIKKGYLSINSKIMMEKLLLEHFIRSS